MPIPEAAQLLVHQVSAEPPRQAAECRAADKRAHLDFDIKQGRMEYLLALSIDGPALVTGNVSLQGKLSLPPGPTKFRKRLQITGNFGNYGYYPSYGYRSCEAYHRRAINTGSRYWWRRYRECRGW